MARILLAAWLAGVIACGTPEIYTCQQAEEEGIMSITECRVISVAKAAVWPINVMVLIKNGGHRERRD